MFKKLIILSTIAILGGCETINQASQCDPEKNYIISNPQAMEEYKSLRKSGDIVSIYSENIPERTCNDSSCISFDKDSFSFYEKKLNNNERKGIYTIKAYSKYEDNCIKDANQYNKNKICYKLTKNDEGKILSRYKLTLNTSYKDRTVITFTDMQKNIKLYEYSSQVYSTNALGGPGFSSCPKNKNHPENKFDPIDFPSIK